MKTTYLACVLTLVLVNACRLNVEAGSYAEDRKAAQTALAELHSSYNRRDFAHIYSAASEQFRSTRPFDAFAQRASSTYATLGQVRSSSEKVSSCAPYEVTLLSYASCDKGPATELATFVVREGHAELLQYRLAPGLVPLSSVTVKSPCT